MRVACAFVLAACSESATQTLPPCDELEPARALLDPVPSTLVATIEPDVAMFAAPGELNPAALEGETFYTQQGVGTYHRGPGRARVMRTELGGSTSFGARRSLAYFVQAADPQLVDDESPVRYAVLDTHVFGGALRPQEAYVAHVVSAMNRTLARIERSERPYDFGIVNGDCVDDGQFNEVRWFIDTMDGRSQIRVDSGERDDPAPGPANDPKDPFDATAFPAPWLFVFGNHEVAIAGAFAAMGNEPTAIGDYVPFGARDYTRPNAPIVSRVTVPADPDRRLVSRDELIDALRDSPASPGPLGHGYTPQSTASLGANYEYDAIPGLLRIIHLDTTDLSGGSRGIVYRATVDGFLKPALDRAAADRVLVMIATHHAADSIDQLKAEAGEPIADTVPPADIEALVASYPNMIAWLAGHIHDNRVRPKNGYWEIATSAIADWPLQSRILELVDNGNGTLSLFGTIIDYDEQTCGERRFRRLALMDYLSGWADQRSTDPVDHNVELVIPIPTGLAQTVANATGHTRIESETTLRGL